MKVEAKDIPIIQSFMTEYWKAIKEFYSAELTDEYSSKVYDTCTELGELAGACPDENGFKKLPELRIPIKYDFLTVWQKTVSNPSKLSGRILYFYVLIVQIFHIR